MVAVLTRKRLGIVARIALAGFLFAQAALAIAACQLGERSAAQALLNASAMAGEPCHQDDGDSAAALCVAHCVTQTQSLDKPLWKLPAPAAAPLRVEFFVPAVPAARSVRVSESPAALSGPPRRILFRTLLI
jgi:hypothetical protein